MRTINYILYLFVCCTVINAVPNEYVTNIGKIGKVLFPLLGIVYMALGYQGIKIAKIPLEVSIIIVLFGLGSLVTYSNTFDISDFLQTTLFFIYIVFINMYANILVSYGGPINTFEYLYTKTLQTILLGILTGIVVGLITMVLSGMSPLDIDYSGRVGFGGIYQDRMLFGLLVSAGFLISIGLIKTDSQKKNKLYYFILLFLFMTFMFLARTRTVDMFFATFIVIGIYSFGTGKLHTEVKILLFFAIFSLSLIVVQYFLIKMNFDAINNLSSGRVSIWNLALDYIFNQQYYINGVGNLNIIILKENAEFNYYFQKIEYLYLHSSYIEIMASGSIVALISFLLLLLKTYILSSDFFKMIVFSISLSAFFESYLIQPHILISFLFWLHVFLIYWSAKLETKMY